MAQYELLHYITRNEYQLQPRCSPLRDKVVVRVRLLRGKETPLAQPFDACGSRLAQRAAQQCVMQR